MGQEKPLVGLDRIMQQRLSRRDAFAAVTLVPFALSGKDKLVNKLRENGIRSDLADLLVTQESLESNNTYPGATTDVVDASGVVTRQYVVNGEGLFSSHWDEQKRRYTEYTWPKKLIPEMDPTSLIALPDDKTVIISRMDFDENSREYKSNIHISTDRGDNFSENIEVFGPEAAIIDGKLIEGTDKAIFQADIQGGSEYILFNIPSRDYTLIQANTVEDDEGNTLLSLLPDLDTVTLSPDKKKVIVDGVLYGYDPFTQYGQGPISIFAVGQAHIDLKTGSLEHVSYDSPILKEPRTVTFERDEQGELAKMYVMASIPQRGMNIVDVKTGDKQVIPFEPFDARLKEAYGKGDWEAQFIRLQRVKDTFVATGTTLMHQEIDGTQYTFNKAVAAFWPVESDPVTDRDNIAVRVIDSDPDSFAQARVIFDAREKRLKNGSILEAIVPQFGLASIPLDEKGMPIGKDMLFPDKGLQA